MPCGCIKPRSSPHSSAFSFTCGTRRSLPRLVSAGSGECMKCMWGGQNLGEGEFSCGKRQCASGWPHHRVFFFYFLWLWKQGIAFFFFPFVCSGPVPASQRPGPGEPRSCAATASSYSIGWLCRASFNGWASAGRALEICAVVRLFSPGEQRAVVDALVTTPTRGQKDHRRAHGTGDASLRVGAVKAEKMTRNSTKLLLDE